jgi:hypothetical protein
MNKYSFLCRRTAMELEETLDNDDGRFVLLSDVVKYRTLLIEKLVQAGIMNPDHVAEAIALINTELPL